MQTYDAVRAASSHRQVYETGPYANFPKQVSAVAGSGVSTMRVEQTSFQDAFPAIPEFALATSLRVGAGTASINDGGGWKSVPMAIGQFELKGPGVQRDYDINAPIELLFVTFSELEGRSLIRQMTASDRVDFGGLMESIQPVSPHIPWLMRRLWDEANSEGGTAGRLQTDCHFAALIAALLTEAGHRSPTARTPERLSASQLRRSLEMLNDGIAGEIRLADIANAVALSEFHFIRAFRNTAGLPPHQFQLMLRIKTARGLLTNTNQQVAEVARQCGFAGQSHLGSVFKRMVGMTPTQWRKHSAAH